MVDSTFYIRNIKYDHFGQRTYILDGDSVETYYEYDPDTRRLSRLLNTSLQANEVLQDNEYEYDNVGNILSITDVGRNPRVQTFSYDDADRLIWSEGEIPNEYSSSILLSYKTQLDYSLAGRLLGKNVESKRLSTAMGLFSVLYDNEYHYDDPNNPYAVSYIRDPNGADHEFSWDANGNLEFSFAHATNTKRHLCWTEDNRLQAFLENGDDGGIAAYYNYTADGERNLKLTSPRISIQQNAALLNGPSLIYPTLYASPLITLTKHGYTKHYFEEGRRICSKIGGGFRNVRVEDFDTHVPEMEFDYGELHHRQKAGIMQTFGYCLGVDPQTEQGVDLHEMLVMVESSRNEQEPAFYYHSDHLGSAAYLTHNGQVTQTLNYLPYGEDWVDIQHYMDARYSNMELYTFTGKEKDPESGYHYFGARYYDSEVLTGWLSVDPMADKYPSMSPYNYCAWSPVKLVDPDGRDTILSYAYHTNDNDRNERNYTSYKRHCRIGNSECVVAIGMHGNRKSVFVSNRNGTGDRSIGASEFAKKIRNGEFNSWLWIENYYLNKTTIFVSYACNTGEGPDCFGQELSRPENLPNSIVIAPESKVLLGDVNGGTTVKCKDAYYDKNGNVVEGRDRAWNVFYNGGKVISFIGCPPQKYINQQGGASKFIELIINKYEESH